jgi:hypothetical protein
VEPAAASPSCPRCGDECPAGAARCPSCGFGFLDERERPRVARPRGRLPALARPRGRLPALGAAIAAAAVAAILIAGRDDEPPPPAPVPALEAERRLELRYGGESDDETAAVRCPRRIEPDRTVRCELRYADGIARAMLVRLSPMGELEADIPYPATLRR